MTEWECPRVWQYRAPDGIKPDKPALLRAYLHSSAFANGTRLFPLHIKPMYVDGSRRRVQACHHVLVSDVVVFRPCLGQSRRASSVSHGGAASVGMACGLGAKGAVKRA